MASLHELSSVPNSSSRGPAWLEWTGGVLLLVAIQAVIWWGYNGHVTFWQDDIGETGQSGLIRMDQLRDGKVIDLLRGRSFLGLSYYHVRNTLFGGSFERSLFFFAAFDILSSVLVWLLLRRIVSPVPALAGAMLFAGYLSAYEVQFSFCTGFYPIIICLHLLLFLLGFSQRISLWVKAFLTGIIGVLSMIWYEFFFALLPLYVLIWLIVEWQKERSSHALIKTALAFAFPAILVGIYLLILKSASDPVWNRDAANTETVSLPYRLAVGFWNALDLTIGKEHLRILVGNLKAFWMAYAQAELIVGILAAIIILGFGIFMILSFGKVKFSPK